jgi:uncharacterized membrane protein
MKIFGHPLHLMLVHFPSALLPADLVLSLIGWSRQESVFAIAGFFCLIGGVLSGWMAVLTGFADMLMVRENKIALMAALWHGMVNGACLTGFTLLAYRSWNAYPALGTASTTALIVKAILVLVLFAGNFLGGKLIFKYHIGIHHE